MISFALILFPNDNWEENYVSVLDGSIPQFEFCKESMNKVSSEHLGFRRLFGLRCCSALLGHACPFPPLSCCMSSSFLTSCHNHRMRTHVKLSSHTFWLPSYCPYVRLPLRASWPFTPSHLTSGGLQADPIFPVRMQVPWGQDLCLMCSSVQCLVCSLPHISH